jgi:predicted site-specific integrase-resolvase
MVTTKQKVLDDLIGTSAAARVLGCTVTTVQKWFDSGNLRGALTADGRRLVSKSDAIRVAAERAGSGK